MTFFVQNGPLIVADRGGFHSEPFLRVIDELYLGFIAPNFGAVRPVFQSWAWERIIDVL